MAAYWQETTSGTGPANAAAWVSNATRVAPVRGSVDVSGIGEAIVPDERSRERVFDVDEGQHGIDNPEFPMEFQFEVLDAVTADTSQAAATGQTTLLGHILGGQERGYSTTAAVAGAHTGTAIELTATTGMDEGQFIAVALAGHTDTTACHLRRITGLAAAVATVDQAFPVTPQDGDVVNAVITCYIDQDDLLDSSVNNTTLSWLLQRTATGGTANWECVGCKSQLDSISLDRGAIAKFVTTTFGGQSTPPDNAPSPSWTAEPAYNAPIVVGPDTQVWFEDYGTTTNTLLDCSSFQITPGVPVVMDPLITEGSTGMEAHGGYTTKPEDTMIELQATWSTAEFTDFEADTLKVLRFSTLRAAGQNIGFSFPRVKIRKVEGVQDGDIWRVKILCHALEDAYNSAAGNEDLHRSKMAICYY